MHSAAVSLPVIIIVAMPYMDSSSYAYGSNTYDKSNTMPQVDKSKLINWLGKGWGDQVNLMNFY